MRTGDGAVRVADFELYALGLTGFLELDWVILAIGDGQNFESGFDSLALGRVDYGDGPENAVLGDVELGLDSFGDC